MPEEEIKKQRKHKILKAITVEPVAILLLTGSVLASTTTQTLSLDKACRVNLNLSEAICDAVRYQNTDDNAENEKIVQEYVARLIAFRSIIASVLPCIVLVFAGGWMDVTGRRKIIMFLSVTGEILVQASNIINVVFFYQLKVEFLIFFEAFFGSIFGGWPLLFLAVYSYIADITTERNRTYRLGIVSFATYIGMPIGISLSGFLLNSFGYLTVYIISLLLAVMNMCYILFFLSDPVRTKEHEKHDNHGFVYFLKTFFNPAHLLNSLKVVFKKTIDNRALRLCILLGATIFLFGPMYGETAVHIMSTRYRFGWDEVQYSLFNTYNMVLKVCGAVFSVIVLSMKLGWHDSILGIISTTSKITASFVYCFAATGTIFYLGSVADVLNATAFMAIRSIFSKTVEPFEIGKVYSLIGIFEVLSPLAYVPLYTQAYTATMDSLPGFIFLLGAFLNIPPLFVFIWLFYRYRKTSNSVNLNESVQ